MVDWIMSFTSYHKSVGLASIPSSCSNVTCHKHRLLVRNTCLPFPGKFLIPNYKPRVIQINDVYKSNIYYYNTFGLNYIYFLGQVKLL